MPANRILEVYDWPTSGDANRVWAIDSDEFGWDINVAGGLGYQPLRLNNAILDDQIRAPEFAPRFVNRSDDAGLRGRDRDQRIWESGAIAPDRAVARA